MPETPEHEPTYEQLNAEYAIQIEKMIDPDLDWRQRIVTKANRDQFATFPQMIARYYIPKVKELVESDELKDAPAIEQAYAILGYVEKKAEGELSACEHVFSEFGIEKFGDTEKTVHDVYDETDSILRPRILDKLTVDMFLAESGVKNELTQDDNELALDIAESHIGDLGRVIAALRDLRSIAYHAKKIAPFIPAQRRNQLLEIGRNIISKDKSKEE